MNIEKVIPEELEKDIKRVKKMPRTYRCRNCSGLNETGIFAQMDFEEIGKRITQCGYCGWLTYWERKGK